MISKIRCMTTHVARELIQRPVFLGEYMSAWEIGKFGGIDQLTFNATSKIPECNSPNSVKVKVLASAINPLDTYMLGGYGNVVLGCLKKFYDFVDNSDTKSSPLILGRDFCGEIIYKGPKVRSSLRLGDIVYGAVPPHQQGSQADQLVIDDQLVARKPDALSPLEAAAIPYTAMTAWSALKISGDLTVVNPKSQRVLVLGASGGVGTVAVQLLKAWGSTVIATCSPDAFPLVSSLNADLIIDYTKKESLREIELAGKYDIILDACGNVNSTTYVPFLKQWSNSKFITLRSPFLKNTDSFGLIGGMVKNAATLVENNLAAGALNRGASVRWGFYAPLGAAMKEIDVLVASGQIKPVIDSEFKFSDIPSAYKRVTEGHLRGKIKPVIDSEFKFSDIPSAYKRVTEGHLRGKVIVSH